LSGALRKCFSFYRHVSADRKKATRILLLQLRSRSVFSKTLAGHSTESLIAKFYRRDKKFE
jgi:hypothetical protein